MAAFFPVAKLYREGGMKMIKEVKNSVDLSYVVYISSNFKSEDSKVYIFDW